LINKKTISLLVIFIVLAFALIYLFDDSVSYTDEQKAVMEEGKSIGEFLRKKYNELSQEGAKEWKEYFPKPFEALPDGKSKGLLAFWRVDFSSNKTKVKLIGDPIDSTDWECSVVISKDSVLAIVTKRIFTKLK